RVQMMRIVGLALAAFVAGACGHATTTGSAQNDWATPTGHAMATNPRYVDPMAAIHPAHDRSVFAKSEAPRQQPEPATDVAAPASTEPLAAPETPIAPEPPGAVPPPAEPLPAPETVPDVVVPDTGLPPYVTPLRP
ncbi:MAG TPA: hypothetical protein VF997_15570, partial [Polyangia bacterium]